MTIIAKIKEKISESKVRRNLRVTDDDYENITTGEGIDAELDDDYVPVETDEKDGIGGGM